MGSYGQNTVCVSISSRVGGGGISGSDSGINSNSGSRSFEIGTGSACCISLSVAISMVALDGAMLAVVATPPQRLRR